MLALLAITAIPTVIGTSQGISQQKRQVAEAKRAAKFHLLATWETEGKGESTLNVAIVVLRDGKLYLKTANDQPGHPFTGYYFRRPDDVQCEGLVSTVSVDPPMLNWIYVNRDTLQLEYGTKTQSQGHIVGSWGWSANERYLALEDEQRFVVVHENGEWSLYYDEIGDLTGLPDSPQILDVQLQRRLISTDPVPEAPGVSSSYVRGGNG
ncbi:MAG: hypothetical protein M1818_005149 [Claussenomyces sp. TS43310]|nr:MAG: hypothetical protein M1818_005149 [Claussenomyces sp. TS43310]